MLANCATETPIPNSEIKFLGGLLENKVSPQAYASISDLEPNALSEVIFKFGKQLEKEAHSLLITKPNLEGAHIAYHIGIENGKLMLLNARIEFNSSTSSRKLDYECPDYTDRSITSTETCDDLLCVAQQLAFSADGPAGTCSSADYGKLDSGKWKVCFYSC